MFFSLFYSFCVSLSFESFNGRWVGPLFQNGEHLNDISVTFFSDKTFMEGAVWIISNNSANTALQDAYLGTIKVYKEKDYFITFAPLGSEEPTKISLSEKEFKQSEISKNYTKNGDERYHFYISKSNIAILYEKEGVKTYANIFHDKLPVISKGEMKNSIISIMIGSFLGGISCLLLFYVCFGDRNFHVKTD